MEKKKYQHPEVNVVELKTKCLIGDQASEPIEEPASLDLQFEEVPEERIEE